MNQAIITPVRQSVTVPISADKAFALFTKGFSTWWPTGHHIGQADLAEAVIEPRAGGRWYERGVDGSQCDWGSVLVYQPPERLVLSWQISSAWQYDPDPAHASEVEVRFTETAGHTLVELEHRYLERHGAGAEEIRKSVDSSGGWADILQRFRQTAEAA
jgi:uncharacterized protein YndB with AHSA1/START domain